MADPAATSLKPFRIALEAGRSVAVVERAEVQQAAESLAVVEGVLNRVLSLMKFGNVEMAQQGIVHVRQAVARWSAEAGELAEQLGKAQGEEDRIDEAVEG